MNIHQLLQRQLKNMKDMRIIANTILMINMNNKNSDDEKLLGKLTPEQAAEAHQKRTDHHLKYTKSAAQKFSNRPRMYSVGKSFYRAFFKIYPNSIHVLPDFIIFAEGKCGTTSLYEAIVAHPNVHRALQKEIYFFDAEFQRGVSWYKRHFPFVWKKYLSTKIQGKKFLTGEATLRYCTHPYAPERAYELIPKVKLIALLRNPIDKALSTYHLQLANGREKLSFEDGLKEEESRIGGEMEKMEKDENYYSANFFRYSYLTRGIYINGLKKWMNTFPRAQFFFQDSESFFKNPSIALNQIYEFLNLPKFQAKQYPHYGSRKYPSMKPETRKLLIEHFKPYNEKLYKLIGKSFDWDK